MKKSHPRVAFFYCFMAERSRALRALRGGFEGLGLQAQDSPNRPSAVAHRAMAPRAEGARSNINLYQLNPPPNNGKLTAERTLTPGEQQ
jgi:hypothetical protein